MDDDFNYIGGSPCLDFANARARLERWLEAGRYGELLSWSVEAGTLDEDEARRLQKLAAAAPDLARATLERAVALSAALRRLFSALAEGESPAGVDLVTVNAELVEAMSHARVVEGDGAFAWSWAAADKDPARVLWPIARSAAELLVSEESAQVKRCAADTCRWLFVDSSRNHRRRWCDMKVCGNRAKVRRFRARAQ